MSVRRVLVLIQVREETSLQCQLSKEDIVKHFREAIKIIR